MPMLLTEHVNNIITSKSCEGTISVSPCNASLMHSELDSAIEFLAVPRATCCHFWVVLGSDITPQGLAVVVFLFSSHYHSKQRQATETIDEASCYHRKSGSPTAVSCSHLASLTMHNSLALAETWLTITIW